jgi:predicted heme/steroid binding protein
MNDGREGRPSWVKVGERLYDVSGSPRWKEGLHFNRHQAGSDLSQALESAPHGPEVLDRMRSFTLEGGSLALETSDVRLLYALAYVNLFVALGVLVTIALRHWG